MENLYTDNSLMKALQWICQNYLWFLMLILVLNLSQRKTPERCMKKRLATLFLAILAMLLEIMIVVILQNQWNPYLSFVALALVIAAGIWQRKRVWPFKMHCVKCGKRLGFNDFLNIDENKCEKCFLEDHPELQKEEIVVEKTFSWDEWEPESVCTLCYILNENNEVLLIERKSGWGTGKISAPGGHVESGETANEACIRETREEVGLEVSDIRHVGILNFHIPGHEMRGHVYICRSYSGQVTETAEARPFWAPVTELPYDKMWQDDSYWLPSALEGKDFEFYAIFDEEVNLINQNIEFTGPEE